MENNIGENNKVSKGQVTITERMKGQGSSSERKVVQSSGKFEYN